MKTVEFYSRAKDEADQLIEAGKQQHRKVMRSRRTMIAYLKRLGLLTKNGKPSPSYYPQ